MLQHADDVGIRGILIRAIEQSLPESFVRAGNEALMNSDLDVFVDECEQVRQWHHWFVEELRQHLVVHRLLILVALVRREYNLIIFRKRSRLGHHKRMLLIFADLGWTR